MPSSVAQSVGVDIAKDTLDVHLHPAGLSRRLANDARGWSALITWLEGLGVALGWPSSRPEPTTTVSSED